MQKILVFTLFLFFMNPLAWAQSVSGKHLEKNVKPNPHQAHTGELRCTLCHKTHEASVLYCNECHQFEMKVK